MFPSNHSARVAFPVDTMDHELDNAHPNTHLCPALATVRSRAKKSKAYLGFYALHVAPLARKYSALYGANLTARHMHALNDVTRARICHGFALPPLMTLEVRAVV